MLIVSSFSGKNYFVVPSKRAAKLLDYDRIGNYVVGHVAGTVLLKVLIGKYTSLFSIC